MKLLVTDLQGCRERTNPRAVAGGKAWRQTANRDLGKNGNQDLRPVQKMQVGEPVGVCEVGARSFLHSALPSFHFETGEPSERCRDQLDPPPPDSDLLYLVGDRLFRTNCSG